MNNLLYVCVCQIASHKPRQADTTKKFGTSNGDGFHNHKTIRRPTLNVAPALMKANLLICRLAIQPIKIQLTELTAPKHIITGPMLVTPSVHEIYACKKRLTIHYEGCSNSIWKYVTNKDRICVIVFERKKIGENSHAEI